MRQNLQFWLETMREVSGKKKLRDLNLYEDRFLWEANVKM